MSDNEGDDEIGMDIAASFDAEAAPSTQVFSIYLPNKDRDGKEIGNQPVGTRGSGVLGRIGGGATAMPPVEGVWMDAEGEFVWRIPSSFIATFSPSNSSHVGRNSEPSSIKWAVKPGRVKSHSNLTNGSIAFADLMRHEVVAMAKKIVATDTPSRRICDLDRAPPIDPARVADALGAEDTGMTLGLEGGPISTFQIRAELWTVFDPVGDGLLLGARPGASRSRSPRVSGKNSRNWRPRLPIWDLSRPLAKSRAFSSGFRCRWPGTNRIASRKRLRAFASTPAESDR